MASAHQFKVKAPMHFSGYAQPNELRYAHVVFFLSFYPHIIQFGRITSDVITGMSVTDFTTVNHIATV